MNVSCIQVYNKWQISQSCFVYCCFVCCFGCITWHVGSSFPHRGLNPYPPVMGLNHWTVRKSRKFIVNQVTLRRGDMNPLSINDFQLPNIFSFLFLASLVACGILGPQPGVEPWSPGSERRSQTTGLRGIPQYFLSCVNTELVWFFKI